MEIDKNTSTSEYATFRQRLDVALRTEDVQQVRAFLIAQGQWSEGTPDDPELAMWLMIAGSPTLQEKHKRAGAWLVEHGHAAEAEIVLGRGKKQQHSGEKGHAARPAKKRHKTSK